MPGHAGAQTDPYPVRPIRFIVPTTPGGPSDVLARLVGERLTEALGRQVITDNRPGAGGRIGLEIASKAAADGYTIFLGSQGNLTVNPALYGETPYDPDKDFAPVVLLVRLRYLLVVSPSVPANNLRELLSLLKSRPGQFSFASPGTGSTAHLAGELFKKAAQVNLVHVPYKGTAPALNDMMSGQVHLMFQSPVAAGPFIKSGRLRAIAIASPHRSAVLPELPTTEESGLPGFEASTWFGILTRAGVPSRRVSRLNQETNRVLRRDDMRARLATLDAEPVGGSVGEFGVHIRSERAKWSKVIKDAGLRVD